MKQQLKQGQRNQTGAIGEQITATFLRGKGFTILDTNYLKKWGELDLVARETLGNKYRIHFVEVKTVSYETREMLEKAVSRGTWRPEENVTFQKLAKLHRTAETWIMESEYTEVDWQIDVAAVRIVPHEKFATIKLIENVIVE